MIVGGVRNGAAEEDWRWDLNPRVAARPKGGPHGFGREEGENHLALAEWGPCGSYTDDGAGSLNHGFLHLFLRYVTPRYVTPDWAEREGRTVHLWVF